MKEKLPDGWEWKKLEDIAVNETNAIVDGPFGSNLKLSDYIENEEIPVISTLNIENGFDKDKLRYISFQKFETIKRSAIKPGDIVMAKIGSCGKCTFYPEWMPIGIIPANLLKITVSKDIDKKYVYYYFKSQVFKNNLNGITKTTAQPAFNISSFKKLPIPLPPLDVQQKIVSILEKAEETKRLRAQADELTQQLLKSVFLEMFGDPVRNEKGWNSDILSSYVEIPLNSGWSPVCSEDNNGIAVFSLGNLTDNGLSKEVSKYYQGENPKKGFDLRYGDILISRSNTRELIGRVGMYQGFPTEVIYPDLMIRIRVNTNVLNPIYFEKLLQTEGLHKSIQKLAHGTSGSMVKISQENLNDLQIITPPLPLQQKFATIVEHTEKIREQQAQSSQQINTLFDSLMKKAFTGELVS